MIFNWSPFIGQIEFFPITLDRARQVAPKGWKPTRDREYLITEVTNKHFVDKGGAYTHPSPEDVFVFGEEAFGLDHVLQASRLAGQWNFKLLVHRLKKSVYGPTKSFGTPYDA